MAAGTKGKRNIWIDDLRLVFAVVIVLHHSRYVLGDDNCVFLGGSLAVEFFFFVSGYLLMRDCEKAAEMGREKTGIGSETFHFLLRKIRSFLPEFLIAWGIGFVFVAAAEGYPARKVWHAFMDDFWELTLVKMSGLFTHGIDGVMWYLSAMLLGMAILYPLLRRHQDLMTHLVCPLTALFFYGYLCRVEGHPRDPVVWLGFAYKGLIRGIAGLSVGVVIRMAVLRLQRKAPKGLSAIGAWLVTIVELICFGLVMRYMAVRKPSEYDYFYLFLMMILVLLCFSGFGIGSRRKTVSGRGRGLAHFASKYSLSLYLSHLYFAQHINTILPESLYSGTARMAAYLALAFGNGLLVMVLSSLWRKHSAGVRQSVRKIIVKQ